MLGSKKLPQPAGTIQNQKRNTNNHGDTNQISQAGAIKFAARQSDNRTIKRASAQNTWIETIKWEAKCFKKSLHGVTNAYPTFHSLATTRQRRPWRKSTWNRSRTSSPKTCCGSKVNGDSTFIAPMDRVVPDLKKCKYHKKRQNQKAQSCYKRH